MRKTFFFCACALALSLPAFGEKITPMLIYGVSVGGKKLTVVKHHEKAGKPSLEVVQTEKLGFPGRAIACHLNHRKLYIASNVPSGEEGSGAVVFTIEKGGKVTKSQQPIFRHGYDYLSLDRAGGFLLGASYREGYVDVYPISKSGMLGPMAGSAFEKKDKAHAVGTSLDNQFAYVPYVKEENTLHQYVFSQTTGTLAPLDPPTAPVPAGAGPRHIAFHPTRPYVYFSNEQQLGVTAYEVTAKGTLKLMHVVGAMGAEAGEGLAASDIAITPDGRYLYVGVRGFGKPLNAVFSYVVREDGRVKPLGMTTTDKIPWAIEVAPDGKHLFVSATEGGTLTSFAIDEFGGLKKAASLDWGSDFRDIVVLRAGGFAF